MKIELNSISDWSDISFHQYKKLLKLAMEYTTDNESQIIDIEPLKYRLKQVAVLNPEIKEEDIAKLTLPQLTEYINLISFIDNEPVKESLKQIELQGKIYKLIDFKDMSLSQWIDGEKYSQDIEDHHKVIAIFYLKPEEYSDIERDILSEYIDNLPCSKVFYIISLFFFIQKVFERASQDYSERIEKKMKRYQAGLKILNKLQKWYGSKSFTKSQTTI